MLLKPKAFKYPRNHCYLPQNFEIESKKIKIKRGSIALKALQSGHISASQIESFRRVVIRVLRLCRGSRLWICIYPFLCLTKKPKGVRMGSGKGAPNYWVATVKKGKILFEVQGLTRKRAISVLSHAKTKLALKTVIIFND